MLNSSKIFAEKSIDADPNFKKSDADGACECSFDESTSPKLNDLGAPIISCVIRNIIIERALLNLGAIVNLLSNSIYDRFPFEKLKLIPVTL